MQKEHENYVALPEKAERIVAETMVTVNAREQGLLPIEADASGRAFMFCFIVLLTVACSHLSIELMKKDKKLFAPESQFLTANQNLTEVDLLTLNQVKLDKAMKKMQQSLEKRTALNKIQASLMARNYENRILNEEEARDLLLRAGYMPSEIDEQKIAKVKEKHENIRRNGSKIEQDVDFAKHVANDIVKDEIESFAHKVRLISVVGGYLFDRVTDE